MEELNYTCCFCNKTVENKNTVHITICINNQQCSQSFYCHIYCFAKITQKNIESYSVTADEHNNIVFFKNCNHRKEKNKDIKQDKETWNSFINKLDSIQDSLITSIFRQAVFIFFDSDTKKIYVEFPKDFVMFDDMLLQAKKQWEPLLQEVFEESAILTFIYKKD